MNHALITALLRNWEAVKPFTAPIMYDVYTAVLGQMVGDRDDWLSWYATERHECDIVDAGRGGPLLVICGIGDLAELILEARA